MVDKPDNIEREKLFENINYDREWFDRGGKHSLENRVSDLLEFLPDEPSFDAIDIGCAEGQMIDFFAKHFNRFDGIERSESLYETALARFQDSEKTQITHASIDSYQLSRSYDYVFFLGVLHYFQSEETRERVLSEIMEKTKSILFVRTSFLENRISRPSEKNLHIAELKSCSLLTIAKLSDVHGFRWRFIDNRYRGTGATRLGDLVILQRLG